MGEASISGLFSIRPGWNFRNSCVNIPFESGYNGDLNIYWNKYIIMLHLILGGNGDE